jgi:antirestriction protein ArdC
VLGYCVRKGETSRIRVWAPCPPSKKKLAAWRAAGANPDDRPRTHFRLEAVFSAAQVQPLPPPADPVPLDPPIAEVQGDSLACALARLEQLAAELGYQVKYRALEPGHGGSCNPHTKVLTINSEQAVNAQVDTLCHELAHALVRHDRQDDDPKLDYAQEELVAESVAHIAVSFVGLDSSASAVPYLASWAESAAPGTFERIAALVDRLARRLEDTLGADSDGPAPAPAPAVAAAQEAAAA